MRFRASVKGGPALNPSSEDVVNRVNTRNLVLFACDFGRATYGAATAVDQTWAAVHRIHLFLASERIKQFLEPESLRA